VFSSLGYQAELTLRLAFIAVQRKQTTRALEAMARAADFARAAGGNRILAGIALERARILRTAGRSSDAEAALRDERSPDDDDLVQIMVVAGARNQHYLQLWRPAA
jgi:hypothetical protein